MSQLIPNSDYADLISRIATVYTTGQRTAMQSAQRTLLLTYWQIGQTIIEFEQGGQARADYGSQLITRLSRDLSHQFGKGFDRSNLIYMRLLYRKYANMAVLSHQLTWAHYVELVKMRHDLVDNEDD
ncbi:DUF1016 N-terminal domain-containing protein [Fibrella aquatilis]|uniref:YhcG N-terminal domain-containing protein n=1 Tax=Fibrella aquatilis TaxID=2817059 RepID=A0A939GB54_9BACT|nr:DUF1016 N-terminal domain-containing protein [Fibrella aquatilis]MBO0933630.1 hypothetical protein [Fibrella aquatilis]